MFGSYIGFADCVYVTERLNNYVCIYGMINLSGHFINNVVSYLM